MEKLKPVHHWWECKIAAMENSMAVMQKKIKHRTAIWSSNSTSGYMSRRTESGVLKWYLYTHVYSIIIHNK